MLDSELLLLVFLKCLSFPSSEKACVCFESRCCVRIVV